MKRLVSLVAVLAFASSLSARDDVKYHSLDFLNGQRLKNFCYQTLASALAQVTLAR
ncbi:hypothetical protein VBZ67_03270 [Campylobacter concisus]